MKVLHINQQNTHGGAAGVANDLVEQLNDRGVTSELWYFGNKGKNSQYARCIYPKLEALRKNILANKIFRRLLENRVGFYGDVSNPFFSSVKNKILNWKPDVLHLHNLHGGWVDLESMAEISQQIPLVITLHDEWLVTGHCGFSIDCLGWKEGCNHCPHLDRYVTLKRPISKQLRDKKAVFLAKIAKAGAVLVTPSEWLKKRVLVGGLWKGKEIIVVNNGLDPKNFYTPDFDKMKLRSELNLPVDEKIAFFLADGGSRHSLKGYSTLRKAIETLPPQTKMTLVVAGEPIDMRATESVNNVTIIRIGYLDSLLLKKYYRAVDLFLYPTLADNFSLVILEAMFMGLPMITTNVGGNIEIVQDGCGIVIEKENAVVLMNGILDYLLEKNDYRKMSLRAKERAEKLFTQENMVSGYLAVYSQLTLGDPS